MQGMQVPGATMRELLGDVPQVGRLTFIGLRPARHAPVVAVTTASLVTDRGLTGDRYAQKGGKRQVSLIQAEHLPVIGAFATAPVVPELLRRNLVIEGIPLAALRRLRFSIGEAELEGTDRCAPCSRMREALGPGRLRGDDRHGRYPGARHSRRRDPSGRRGASAGLPRRELTHLVLHVVSFFTLVPVCG